MKITSTFFVAVSALVVFCGAARAADNVLLAVNKPVKAGLSIKTAELAPKATAQINIQAAESEDFDAFSAVNDPLYREGSKEFLEQVSRQDEAKTEKAEPEKKAPVNKTELRDAPNSPAPAVLPAPVPVKAEPAIRKSRLMKVIPADPVKAKNTL